MQCAVAVENAPDSAWGGVRGGWLLLVRVGVRCCSAVGSPSCGVHIVRGVNVGVEYGVVNGIAGHHG